MEMVCNKSCDLLRYQPTQCANMLRHAKISEELMAHAYITIATVVHSVREKLLETVGFIYLKLS